MGNKGCLLTRLLPPQLRGKEPDRLPIHVIAVEKLLIGRLSKCHLGQARIVLNARATAGKASPTLNRHHPHLLKHFDKIKAVPRLHALSPAHPEHQHPLERDRHAGGFDAERGAGVRRFHFAIGGDLVIF